MKALKKSDSFSNEIKLAVEISERARRRAQQMARRKERAKKKALARLAVIDAGWGNMSLYEKSQVWPTRARLLKFIYG